MMLFITLLLSLAACGKSDDTGLAGGTSSGGSAGSVESKTLAEAKKNRALSQSVLQMRNRMLTKRKTGS